MTRPRVWKIASIIFLLCAAIASPAQTFKSAAVFTGTNGTGPQVSLTQGPDGNYYGVTVFGGDGTYHTEYLGGVFFRVTANGALTPLYNFCSEANCADGAGPDGGLLLAMDGNFYGTANGGGANNYGTVFKMTPEGQLTTLHNFCSERNCADGMFPSGTLVQGTNGNFYGTTQDGGPHGSFLGGGIVFKITPSGDLTTLYGFCALEQCRDGSGPESVGLVQASDGNFYGTTVEGGANANSGTAFKITPQGALTTLHNFCSESDCNDGTAPRGSLIQGTDGNIYGTTAQGGLNAMGVIFRISPRGTLTSLYIFCNESGDCPDGAGPTSGLIQATDGNFYGTSTLGGTNGGGGTIFKFTPEGALTTLYSFCLQTNCADGDSPIGGLLQATSGDFYGTADFGGLQDCAGSYGCGTFFRLDTGLGAFVTFVHAAGQVGQTVGILGQSLTGTSAVSFNGTTATFTVISDTFMKVTVPAGATTGYVTVTTQSGGLTSNVPFDVIQ